MTLTVVLHGDPAATQQARLASALVARGHHVVLCDAPGIAARVRATHPDRCTEMSSHPRLPMFLRRLLARRTARKLGASVVHLNSLKHWHTLWIGILPYVATAWGSDLNDEVFPKPRHVTRAVDRVLVHAAAVTADSNALLQKARARAKGSRAPFELVFWGVDRALFDPAKVSARARALREELGIPEGTRVLLSPRQNKPHYHVDRILRAFAASAWSQSGVMVIKLHGREDDAVHEARLRALAEELSVATRVHFAPPCSYEDLPATYAMADVAVSALEADGVPSTFCELMSLGVPIVATDLPDYAGVLAHEDRALLVPPGNHAALVGALDRLAADPTLGAALAKRGKAWAEQHADWERCVDRWEALYRKAIA
ncbi:glycosyltransferase family 4 protein [Polyangium sp. 15x6]|uniref:glycosyltransferase family 4 protein n=1 Tax=Polyangium sp. 15x6 TaxID=3042687 RepID=UPI00249A54DE|nr:glycosyltransferase family 4 protein [Polyangium sp. 15x6]MDI3286258.1 glycosyltransferase family 4 protein [Polyangium sp. 15x6]